MRSRRTLVAAVVLAATAAAAYAAPTADADAEDEAPSTSLQLYRPSNRQARGYDDHHYMEPIKPATPSPEEERAKASEAITSYYEFLVNEGSYKFWAVFEIVTAALLIYSAFAAIYYAKYTYATTDYDDYFFKRSGDLAPLEYDDSDSAGGGSSSFLGMSSTTFTRILDAIASDKYS